uniref:Uncharacterized protein n=1 Tax=Panagrolaimus superbus TaxID=310955 RepID=A0A914YPG4_9BILA
MILKISFIFIAFCFCKKITNASSFEKETVHDFLDHPHFKQVLTDFIDAGHDLIMGKEEKEILMLQIMFKNNEYIHASMHSGMAKFLVEYMNSKNPDLQFQALKAVSKAAPLNVQYAEEIVDEGAVKVLIKNLHSKNPKIVVESFKAIGSIIFKNPELRDQFLKFGLAEHLVEFVLLETPKEVLIQITHIIMLLALNQEKTPISKETVKTLLPAFRDLIHDSNPKIVKDITWALVFLTDGGNKQYNINFKKETVEDLFKLVFDGNYSIRSGAIGVISNIINGSNAQTKMALDNGILKLLPELLMQENDPLKEDPPTIINDSLLILEKLFAASDTQAKAIFDTGIMPLIIYHLARGSQEERHEAAWVVSAATSVGNKTHISKMVDSNVVIPLCKVLIEANSTSANLVEVILKGLNEILKKSEADRIEEIYQSLEKCGGIEIVAFVGEHGNDMTTEFADKILRTFCSAEIEAVCKASAS